MAKILVVDDKAVNREFVVTLLGYKGHELLEAEDGAEALVRVRSESPDLVICDLLMPSMDGFEFVRLMRADPAIAHTPVIFFTAHYHEREARNLARGCGVSDILFKPCEPEEVVRTVDRALSRDAANSVVTAPSELDREHRRLVTDKMWQTVEDLRATNQRLAALTELNLQFASERDPSVLLGTVCHGARELLGARYAVLCVSEKDGDGTIFHTSGIAATSGNALLCPEMDSGLLGEIVAARLARRINNPGGEASAVGLPPDYPPLSACLAAPVMSLSRTFGWILLADKLGAEAFSGEDEKVLSVLAAQAGRIYENGSLYREVKRHSDQLQAEIVERKVAEGKVSRLNRVYAVLSGINALIVRARNRDHLFKEACQIAVDQGQFKMAWIGVVAREQMKVVPVASAGIDAEFWSLIKEGYSLHEDGVLGNTITSRAAREKRAMVSDDIRTDKNVRFSRERVERGILSMAVMPLVVSGAVEGVLCLFAHEEGFFDEGEMRLLNELAGDIAFALDHIEKVERLDYLAYYDEITGLPNRTLFLDRMNQYLRAREGESQLLALALIDINGFRRINETFGRQAGDELLRTVALRMRDNDLEFDTVARTNNNCFGVAMRNARDGEAVALAIEKLVRACFSREFRLSSSDLRVGARVGIALYPVDGSDAEMLIRNAEAALERAKGSVDEVVFYAPEMNRRIAESLQLESRLRKALDLEQFVLHYQPKINIASGKLTGAEALIRWNDPQAGLIPPLQFIPILEESGLIYEVGRWALHKGVEDYLRWRKAGLPAVRIAVNVSPVQVRHRDFVGLIRQVVGLDPHASDGLELEITETVIMENLEQTIEDLRAVRAMKVGIAIDDFGTGFSSLRYLSKLPVTSMKIDRSFVEEMTSGSEGLALVSTMISLANSLRINVVAEGVETEEQVRLLRLLRCDEMQGFYFSKPVPREVFESRFLVAPLVAQ